MPPGESILSADQLDSQSRTDLVCLAVPAVLVFDVLLPFENRASRSGIEHFFPALAHELVQVDAPMS